MRNYLFRRLTLGGAGLTALGIGLAITFMPHGFYAGYGIEIGNDPTMLSELRAPGASLTALGALILAGALRSDLTTLSAVLGSVVFLAFAFGRLTGIALDGVPAESVVAALGIELIVGALCLLSLRGDHKSWPLCQAHSPAISKAV